MMNRIKITLGIFLTAFLFMVACQDDDHELGAKLDKSEVTYTVTQDFVEDPGGNTVVMVNSTPGTVSIWDFGTGRSNNAKDTVRFAFKGTYVIKLSVMTAGGVVEMDPVTVEVTEDNLEYVNDPLWTFLTGGVGNSKTWILDNGKYGYAPGPLSYADPNTTQEFQNYKPNWEPTNMGHTEADLAAEMTFSLDGGPFLTTVKPNEEGGDESGTYSLNTDSHTLTTTDATIIRMASFIPNATNWTSDLKILELTETQLRIAVMRTNSEGPWWYIFNFVEKEYAENYVPEFVPDPNFDHGDQMFILAGNSSTTWKLDTQTPFNWVDLNGNFLNPWNSMADYPGWTGFDANAVANFDNARLTFYKTGDVIFNEDNGTVHTGTISLNATKNQIVFNGFKPSIYISGGWVYATTTNYFEDGGGNVITRDNEWKLIRTKSVSGVVTDIWFGKRSTEEKNYMVYHFTLENAIPLSVIKNEMIKGLCGGVTGTTSRKFMIDVNWPVDWSDLAGTTWWTVPGTQDGWYWNDDIEASVVNQTLTFSQTNGVVTATKRNEAGVISMSPVTIDPATRSITISDMDIVKFGAGSWLPTAGPTYYWARGEFNEVKEEGFWIGLKTNTNEFTAYHYIVK